MEVVSRNCAQLQSCESPEMPNASSEVQTLALSSHRSSLEDYAA
jgi:hypothetical protein